MARSRINPHNFYFFLRGQETLTSQEDGFCPEHSDCGACSRNEGEGGGEDLVSLVERARLNWLALSEFTIPIPAVRRQGRQISEYEVRYEASLVYEFQESQGYTWKSCPEKSKTNPTNKCVAQHTQVGSYFYFLIRILLSFFLLFVYF